MSRKDNCYDNAVVESWFKTVRAELGSRFDPHPHAKEELFDYIEIFYDQQRRRSALDYVSPADYERATAMKIAAQSNRPSKRGNSSSMLRGDMHNTPPRAAAFEDVRRGPK
jgi:hypothetical protein